MEVILMPGIMLVLYYLFKADPVIIPFFFRYENIWEALPEVTIIIKAQQFAGPFIREFDSALQIE